MRAARADPLGPGAGPRVALVSGGNRGLGRAIAAGLADAGLRVVVGSRDLAAGERAAAAIGRGAGAVALDVADPASASAAVAEARRRHGRLDVLVSNAGIIAGRARSAVHPDPADVRRALEVNLLGPWELARAAVPGMVEAGYGRVVNVSSEVASFARAGTGSAAYRVSKAALNMLTRLLALELRGTGVLVNAACPGWVRTDMGGPAAPRSPEEGADTPVWLATLPDDGPTGGFFRDRRPIPW